MVVVFEDIYIIQDFIMVLLFFRCLSAVFNFSASL